MKKTKFLLRVLQSTLAVGLFLLLLQTDLFSEEPPVYQLVSIIKNADIDASFIKQIDSIQPPYPKHGSFPIGDLKYTKGKYTVLKFMNVRYGHSSESSTKRLFHYLFVVKIDAKNKIIDGYHYTLDWQDTPSINLERITKKGKLKQGMSITELYTKTNSSDKPDLEGVIDTVFDSKYQY